MWEGKMCIEKATLAELAEVQAKLELAGVQARDRSPSPIPGIQRALFQVLFQNRADILSWRHSRVFISPPTGWCHFQPWKSQEEEFQQAQSGGGTEKKFRLQRKQVLFNT